MIWRRLLTPRWWCCASEVCLCCDECEQKNWLSWERKSRENRCTGGEQRRNCRQLQLLQTTITDACRSVFLYFSLRHQRVYCEFCLTATLIWCCCCCCCSFTLMGQTVEHFPRTTISRAFCLSVWLSLSVDVFTESISCAFGWANSQTL